MYHLWSVRQLVPFDLTSDAIIVVAHGLQKEFPCIPVIFYLDIRTTLLNNNLKIMIQIHCHLFYFLDCGEPPSVIRGYPNYTETTYQAIATYFCDIGYNLTGDLTAECLDDDSWSGNRTCDIVGKCLIMKIILRKENFMENQYKCTILKWDIRFNR